MRRVTTCACAVFAVLAMSAPVALAGPGGGSGGPGGGGGGPGGFGGNSAAHVSPQGITNSNGPNSLDRDLGPNRAGDVMSPQGLSNTNGPNATDRDLGTDRAGDVGQ